MVVDMNGVLDGKREMVGTTKVPTEVQPKSILRACCSH